MLIMLKVAAVPESTYSKTDTILLHQTGLVSMDLSKASITETGFVQLRLWPSATLERKKIWRKVLDEIQAPASRHTFDRQVFRDLRHHLARAASADSPSTPDRALCILSIAAWIGHISDAGGDNCDMPAGTS